MSAQLNRTETPQGTTWRTLRAPGMAAVEFALWLVAFAVVLGFLLITAVQALAAPVV